MEPIATVGNGFGMQPGLGPLRDIRGIEGVPWWPLADGWWILLGAMVLIGLAAWHWRVVLRLRVPIPFVTLGSWRWDAASALRDLRRRARAGQDAKTTAGELSELLRRIAMARLGRSACAGLVGEGWLGWLAEKDPKGFAWRERGRTLIEAPYAPLARAGDRGQTDPLLELIDAAYAWVSAPAPRQPQASEAGGGTRWRRLRLPGMPRLRLRPWLRLGRAGRAARDSALRESAHV
jgi:hypothetical protein